MLGSSCKAIVVYTGDLARIDSDESAAAFVA